LIAAAALLMSSLLPLSADAGTSSGKPTVVLVHGAWADPSSWTQGEFFNSPACTAPPFFRPTFAEDVPVTQANAMNAAQRPINAPILGTPSGPVAWHTLPSWSAVSGADRIIDPAEERFMAARAGATTIEFPTASHAGGITVHHVCRGRPHRGGHRLPRPRPIPGVRPAHSVATDAPMSLRATRRLNRGNQDWSRRR
jgi:hypothetical protein